MLISGQETAERVIKLYEYFTTHASPTRAIKMKELQHFLEENGYQHNWRTVKKDLEVLFDCGIEWEYNPNAQINEVFAHNCLSFSVSIVLTDSKS